MGLNLEKQIRAFSRSKNWHTLCLPWGYITSTINVVWKGSRLWLKRERGTRIMLARLYPFCYRVPPSGVLRSDDFLFSIFQKKIRHTIRVSNNLDPGQEHQYLGPNCLQWLKQWMTLVGLVNAYNPLIRAFSDVL